MAKKRKTSDSEGQRVTMSGLVTAVIGLSILFIVEAVNRVYMDWYVQPNRC